MCIMYLCIVATCGKVLSIIHVHALTQYKVMYGIAMIGNFRKVIIVT